MRGGSFFGFPLARLGDIMNWRKRKKADILILETSDYRDLAYRFGGNLVAGAFKGGRSVWPQEVD